MKLRRFVLAISLIAALSPLVNAADVPAASSTAKRYGTWGVDLDAMDRSVKPGDDFFRFVNGKWVAATPIPADKTSIGSFAILRDLSEVRVHQILDRWAADKSLKPASDEAKVAALYRTFMDEAAVEKLDAKPLQPYLDAIRGAKTYGDVAGLMGRSHGSFGASLFRIGIGDDAKAPDTNTLYLSPAGLGLPDREDYLSEN